MLKGFILLLSVFCLNRANAQELVVAKLRSETSRNIKKDTDTANWNWKQGGLYNLNVAQSSLSNWAAGGDNFNMTINSYFNYFAFYKKERQNWDNNLDVNLGFVQSTSQGGRKNDDRLDLLSKYGYKMDTVGKWYLSGLFNFRSQLFDGYSFSGTKATFTSSFFAPAYMIISAGLDYPGIGPLHAFLYESKRGTFLSATDEEALASAFHVSKTEGIIPALETAHAFSVLPKLGLKPTDVVIVCLSGRGDKDLSTYMQYL